MVSSHIAQLGKLLPKLRFLPPATLPGSQKLRGHARQVKSELLTLTRMVQPHNVKCATTSRDYVQRKR
jgi:hypothetical protein